jgi:hypothetical protein
MENKDKYKVDKETIDMVKKKNASLLWVNAIIPALIFGILGSWFFDSFWFGIGIGIGIWLINMVVSVVSGSIIFHIFGGKNTQVETFFVMMRDSNLPIPDKYAIDMPDRYYEELLGEESLDHRLTITLTSLLVGIELARNQGAFVRLFRLLKTHKLALAKYRKYRVQNKRDTDTFIHCPKCNEAIDKDSDYCIYCSKKINENVY